MKKLLFLLVFIPLVSFGQTAKEYFNSAENNHKIGDYKAAIEDYTKSIELNPDKNNLATCYSNRGRSKSKLKDINGAIADYTKAIEIRPKFAPAYYNRGLMKRLLNDHNGAIADYTKAIELNPNYTAAYNNRAIAKYLTGLNGCPDLMKVKELGGNVHPDALKVICN